MSSDDPTALPNALPIPAPVRRAFDTVIAALVRDYDEDSAAALRGLLRRDQKVLRDAEARLLDPNTLRELRMALAFVLGTLGTSDAVLIEALQRYAKDTELVRCLLFGLGATREPPDDDEVFGLGDRPWGVNGPGGMGITVRHRVDDPAARDALARHLRDKRDSVREAAAIALRHSTMITSVRTEFVSSLQAEPSDDVAGVLGEALAVWAGATGSSAEQTSVVNTLLARAADDGFDGYRFLMEDNFRRIALDASQQATLAAYAGPTHSYAVRSFALNALSAAAPGTARPLLERYVSADDNAAVRDLSAHLLGWLPESASSIRVLVAASVHDTKWSVRFQAVDALARFPKNTEAAEAIRAARQDPDPRVAKRATAAER